MEEHIEIMYELISNQSLTLSNEGMFLLGFISSKRMGIEEIFIIKIQALEALCFHMKISQTLKNFFKVLIIYNIPGFASLINICLTNIPEDDIIANLPENMQKLYYQIFLFNQNNDLDSINTPLNVGVLVSSGSDMQNEPDEKRSLKESIRKMEEMKLKTSTKNTIPYATSEKKLENKIPDCDKNDSKTDIKILEIPKEEIKEVGLPKEEIKEVGLPKNEVKEIELSKKDIKEVELPKREIKEVELSKKEIKEAGLPKNHESLVRVCPECKFWLLKFADFTEIDCPHKRILI